MIYHIFAGLDLHYADHAKHHVTAGLDLEYLDRDMAIYVWKFGVCRYSGCAWQTKKKRGISSSGIT